MVTAKQLLTEGNALYKVDILLKTRKDANKVEIYNQIRGLTNVVVLTIEQSSYLDSQKTDIFEYSLMHLKFLTPTDPKAAIEAIKKDAMITTRIPGLLQFVIRYNTILLKGKY